MWGETHGASDRVMNRVVICEEGHAEDVNGEVCWENLQETLSFIIFDNVIFCRNFDPPQVEHKPQSRILFALC